MSIAFRSPPESGSLPPAPFLVQVRFEEGVLEVAVEGDLDQTSVPILLDEIRLAASLFEVFDQTVNQPASPRIMSIDLSDSRPLEADALDEVMALVHQLEADDVAVGFV
jgi:hypothetical protein